MLFARRNCLQHVEYHIDAGLLPASARKFLRTQLVHHGIAANKHVLETAAQYSLEQGLTPRLVALKKSLQKLRWNSETKREEIS